jgi:hypothetical protein
MMNVVSMAHGESKFGEYLSPEVFVVEYRSEGVMCQSLGSEHGGFDYDDKDIEDL